MRRVQSPAFVEPMAAKLVDVLPDDDRWIYEVKWDGYRALLLKDDSHVELRSRNNKDLTATYAAVVAAGARLNARTAVVDGEIVAVDAHGRPSFQALQHRTTQADHAIAFYAFDLLHVNGRDLRREPLEARRAQLPSLLRGSGLLLSESLPGRAAEVIEAVAALGLEGIVAKRLGSRYEAGERTGAWVKLKLDSQQEFVIGGYRPGNHGVDALLVGVYQGKALTFAGKVRAGFTPHTRRALFAALRPLHSPKCPFVDLPTTRRGRWGSGVTADEMSEMQWVKPQMVAQIRFVQWTADGLLRHSAFMGIRSDRVPQSVRRET